MKMNFRVINLNLILICIGLFFYKNNAYAQTSRKTDTSIFKGEIQRKYGLDPSTNLPSRVERASAETFKSFEDAGMHPREHSLTTAEVQIVSEAFAILPDLYQTVLKDHLQAISFMDDMPNTALTETLNPDDPYRLYHITFRAAILQQNVSEWLTEKERNCFDNTGSGLSISFNAGKINALTYVLMHEATHVLDGSLGLLANGKPGSIPDPGFKGGLFVKRVWANRTRFDATLTDTLLPKNRYHGGGKVLRMNQAVPLYQALQQTPFVSLYSTSSWHEDLAEFAAVYHFTQVLKQPFEIVVTQNSKIIFQYAPMRSANVRGRIFMVGKFYS